jgi:hypothetical protein
VQELRTIVDNPSYMDQKDYPICGPDTYMRTFATKRPELYVAMVIDLMTTGKGRLGTQDITVPKSVKEKELSLHKMHIAEWVAAASLRVQSNELYGNVIRGSRSSLGLLKNLHAGLAGMTTANEVRNWFIAAGVPENDVHMKSHLVGPTPDGMITEINDVFKAGHAVALLVNPKAVSNEPDKSISRAIAYRHVVTLASEILLESDNYLAKVMTWGSTKRMVCKKSEMSRTFLGYISADLSSLTNPPVSAPAEAT